MDVKVLLYTDYEVDAEQLKEYVEFFQSNFGLSLHHFYLQDYLDSEDRISFVSEQLAKIRVIDINKNQLNVNLFPIEIEYEKRHLTQKGLSSQLLYDGYEFQLLLRKAFPDLFKSNFNLNIVLTNRKILTFIEEKRYHLRTVILGLPCIISKIGLIEAPAKPREYYVLKAAGINQEIRKWLEENRTRYLSYEDERLPEVVKGYMVQCLFYWLNNEMDYCQNVNCALHNSHWQEEVLKAQYNHMLCEEHREIIERELKSKFFAGAS